MHIVHTGNHLTWEMDLSILRLIPSFLFALGIVLLLVYSPGTEQSESKISDTTLPYQSEIDRQYSPPLSKNPSDRAPLRLSRQIGMDLMSGAEDQPSFIASPD